MISTYFDFNDYDNPVHHYLQDMNLISMIPDISQTYLYHIVENKAYLNDNIFIGSQGTSDQLFFYSVGEKDLMMQNFKLSNNTYFSTVFVLDQNEQQY